MSLTDKTALKSDYSASTTIIIGGKEVMFNVTNVDEQAKRGRSNDVHQRSQDRYFEPDDFTVNSQDMRLRVFAEVKHLPNLLSSICHVIL